MRIPLNPCYILHQRAYRETSLILDLFSRDHGKVAVLAKGARRAKSGIASLVQLHQRLIISWSGKGELGTLTGVEADGKALNINGRRLMVAFYLDELLMRLLHRHEGHPELFDAYDLALEQLNRGEAEHPLLRAFELQLLNSLGYGLVLGHAADSGAKIDPGREYYYRMDYGPVSNRPGDANWIKVSGRVLNALQAGDYSDGELMKEAKHLTQTVLRELLGPRPLASRELYAAYLKTRGTE